MRAETTSTPNAKAAGIAAQQVALPYAATGRKRAAADCLCTVINCRFLQNVSSEKAVSVAGQRKERNVSSKRKQFTFYTSFYDAIECLDEKDQRDAYRAICRYAITGEMSELTGAAAAVFLMAKPNLDASKKKAEGGKKGSPTKRTEKDVEKMCERYEEDTANEKEDEKEDEIETEKESDPPLSPLQAGEELRSAFSSWLAYKQERREPYKPVGLQALASEVRNKANTYGEKAVAAVIRQSMANGWKGICFDKLKDSAPPPKRVPQGGNVFLELLEDEP